MSLKLTYYMKKNILILIFFNLLISGIDDIYETRFEKFWKKTFNQLNYREPVKFIPYNLFYNVYIISFSIFLGGCGGWGRGVVTYIPQQL